MCSRQSVRATRSFSATTKPSKHFDTIHTSRTDRQTDRQHAGSDEDARESNLWLQLLIRVGSSALAYVYGVAAGCYRHYHDLSLQHAATLDATRRDAAHGDIRRLCRVRAACRPPCWLLVFRIIPSPRRSSATRAQSAAAAAAATVWRH